MELGLEYTDKMALPPGLPLWKLIGYCIPECTRVVSDYATPSTRSVRYALRSVIPYVCPRLLQATVHSGLYCSFEIRKSKRSHRLINVSLCSL